MNTQDVEMTDPNQTPIDEPLAYAPDLKTEGSASKYGGSEKLVAHKTSKARTRNMIFAGMIALVVVITGVVLLLVLMPSSIDEEKESEEVSDITEYKSDLAVYTEKGI